MRRDDPATFAFRRSDDELRFRECHAQIGHASGLAALLAGSLGQLALLAGPALAVVGAVIGEYLSATRGIGYIIANAGYHLDTALIFAAIAAIAIASLIMFGLVVLLERRIAFWYRRIPSGEP